MADNIIRAAGLALATVLGGCSYKHQWVPAPGNEHADIMPTQAACRVYSKQNTPQLSVFGPPLLLAATIDRNDRERAETFDDCMIVHGWRIAQ